MRILFISAEPVRPRQAIDTHVNEVADRLRQFGHIVYKVFTRSAGRYDRTPVYRRLLGYLEFYWRAVSALSDIDVVYARAHPVNAPIVFWAGLRGIPCVHEVNGAYYDIAITHNWLAPFLGIIGWMQRWQYRRAFALVAVTPGIADWLHEIAPRVPMEIVLNAANCDVFYASRLPVPAVGGRYVLFFGGMTRWHGVETMIAAADNPAWPEGVRLVMIGDGQLGHLVRGAAARNPIICALDSAPQRTLAGYMTGAVVGLVPINSIGGRGRFGLAPLKLFEMLASGLPVIVTDYPIQADLVRELDAGIVVPADDAEALAKAVRQIVTAGPTREKMLGIAESIRANHNWDNRVAQIDSILARIKS